MRNRWILMAAALLAAAPAADAQRPQHTVPRDTGLILGSIEAAIRTPVRRMENMAVIVDLSDRRLYVTSGNTVVREYMVSVGEEGSFDTPDGQFTIQRMIWNPSWTPPPSAWARDKEPEAPGSPGNPMGRVKMFFREPDYYIHGTGLTSSLGSARSHGCIRMRNIDAVELARILMINGGADRPLEWYEETLANASTSRNVTLSRPVTIRVRA
jgi:lipoprotein-anchoring transpeptidase ErfK/SrfK